MHSCWTGNGTIRKLDLEPRSDGEGLCEQALTFGRVLEAAVDDGAEALRLQDEVAEARGVDRDVLAAAGGGVVLLLAGGASVLVLGVVHELFLILVLVVGHVLRGKKGHTVVSGQPRASGRGHELTVKF
jgi:hypothetical protein